MRATDLSVSITVSGREAVRHSGTVNPLVSMLGAVCNSDPPRCGLRSAVAHQTPPSPVGEGRGGGNKQAALATVYKTNCKQPLAGTMVSACVLGAVCNLKNPLSPAGRIPQRAGTHAKCVRILRGARGRVGVGVNDIIDEPKSRFFQSITALTPIPLSLRELFQSLVPH